MTSPIFACASDDWRRSSTFSEVAVQLPAAPDRRLALLAPRPLSGAFDGGRAREV